MKDAKPITVGGEVISPEEQMTFTEGNDQPDGGFAEYQQYDGTYSGDDERLKGQNAIVFAKVGETFCYAQFDKPSTRKCFGWWRFPVSDFGGFGA